MNEKSTIYTAADLIEALGGNNEAARFFGVSRQVVSHWLRQRNRFPAERYFEHQARLAAANIVAHPGIWYPELRDRVVTKTASGWRL